MRGRSVLILAAVWALVLSLSVGLVVAQGPAASEGLAESAVTLTPASITYQGMLKEAGAPVTGPRDMVFTYCTDAACATAASGPSSTVTRNDVPVANGLFSVALDASSNIVNGQALWLGVTVEGTRIACQEILPVPYALSLRPGAVVRAGTTAATLVGVEMLPVFPPRFLDVGVIAEGTWGVLGSSTSSVGVMGRSVSGIAVEGDASALTGETYGVYGKAQSPQGAGLYGQSLSTAGGHGVYAESRAPTSLGAALWAQNIALDGIAIWGRAQGDDSTLVLEHKAGSGEFIGAWQTDPSDLRFRFTVSGDAYADGAFAGGGADLADYLPAAGGLEPGDVLMVNGDGLLVAAVGAYNPAVVGVYSTAPAFAGGADADGPDAGDVPLALAGVVPVKVCAESGAIQPGDLLVASGTAGRAMRGENPPAGTVIGKALGTLAAGEGVIDMLVMLR